MVYLKGEAIQAQLQLHAPYQCKEMCGPRGLGIKPAVELESVVRQRFLILLGILLCQVGSPLHEG